jgi:FMN reductase (NADPH)
MSNIIVDRMLQRRSVRKFTAQKPGDEVIDAIVRAGQQAPFAGQLASMILSRKKKQPFGAPLMFTFLLDLHRMELVMARRGWKMVSCDLAMLFFAMQDASLMAENMVIAAESFGLGSCFLGNAPFVADKLRRLYRLPEHTFPLVHLVMGYPDEQLPPRPRYPRRFACFEETYPELTEEMVTEAMQVMDEGYLAQDYYKKDKLMIKLEHGKKETYTFQDYSWTEHISRKWGQWNRDPQELVKQLKACGFDLAVKK